MLKTAIQMGPQLGWGIVFIMILLVVQIRSRLSLTHRKIDYGRIQSLLDQIKFILPISVKGNVIKASYFISEDGERTDKLNRQAVQETLRCHDIERSLVLVRRTSLPILVFIIYLMMKFIATKTDPPSVRLVQALQGQEELLFSLNTPLDTAITVSVVGISLILSYLIYKKYESIIQYYNTLGRLKEDLDNAYGDCGRRANVSCTPGLNLS